MSTDQLISILKLLAILLVKCLNDIFGIFHGSQFVNIHIHADVIMLTILEQKQIYIKRERAWDAKIYP